MALNSYTAPRLIHAYLMMAERARYRPAAPSDGLGNILIADDSDLRLCTEALQYAEEFSKVEAEGKGDFYLGIPNGSTLPALVYLIEAAKCLCGAADEVARQLLALAVQELDDRTDIGSAEGVSATQVARKALAAVRGQSIAT